MHLDADMVNASQWDRAAAVERVERFLRAEAKA
jgi:hypothetical protein